jgi:transposase
MIDLYRSGATARHVAETFSVSMRSVKRLLQQRGVRRDDLDQRSVCDRLGQPQVHRLVADFESGTPKWKLAQRYGISESSVKRLIRRYRTVSTSHSDLEA